MTIGHTGVGEYGGCSGGMSQQGGVVECGTRADARSGVQKRGQFFAAAPAQLGGNVECLRLETRGAQRRRGHRGDRLHLFGRRKENLHEKVGIGGEKSGEETKKQGGFSIETRDLTTSVSLFLSGDATTNASNATRRNALAKGVN